MVLSARIALLFEVILGAQKLLTQRRVRPDWEFELPKLRGSM